MFYEDRLGGINGWIRNHTTVNNEQGESSPVYVYVSGHPTSLDNKHKDLYERYRRTVPHP